jgi:hypothetical protein
MRRPVVVIAVALSLLGWVTPVWAAPSGGALPPQLTLIMHIAGRPGIPENALGVALNVTVAEPVAPGFLTVYPCGDKPLASNLNYVAGQTVPNFVVAGIGLGGDVCIDTMSTTDVIVDIAGYIPGGSAVVPLEQPQRFLDTREGIGAPRARVAGLSVVAVQIAGTFGIPVDAETVAFNATAVQPSGDGFLTVFPCGQPVPETSSLNFTAGAIVPNLVMSAVGVGGQVCFLSNVETDIVADVAAYVDPVGSDVTMLDRPHRLVDTRVGLGGPAEPIGPPTRQVAVTGQFGVPAGATAAIVNLTATNGIDAGYAAAFPCGGTVPLVSNLNFTRGANVANLAIVRLAADGTMCLTANRSVDVIVDVLGYLGGTTDLVAVEPSRLFDSREGIEPKCGIALGPDVPGQISGATMMLYRVGSGSRTPLSGLMAWEGPPHAFVRADCRIVVLGVRNGKAMADEFSPDGTYLGSRDVKGGMSTDMTPTTNGWWALGPGRSGGTSRTVTEIQGGFVGADLPDNPVLSNSEVNTWNWIGATDDASMVAVWRLNTNLDAEVWYLTPDGDLVDTATLPPFMRPTGMSPDGTYLSLRNGMAPNDLVVSTLYGETVATLANGRDSWFMTPGSMAVCVDPPGAAPATVMRWDLFSPPTPWGASGWPTECRIQATR